MSKATVWVIDYLPATDEGREVGWKFYGTKEQLDQYLLEKHSCSCKSCSRMDWWDTPASAEYFVEEEEMSDTDFRLIYEELNRFEEKLRELEAEIEALKPTTRCLF